MLIGKTRTNQPVEGYQDAPVFEGELEEKEGKVSLDMDTKDCQLIYDKKPMVIGIRLPDEDVEGNFQIVYFTLAIDKKETDDAVMYQLVMTDDEEHTITKLSLAFLDDGDDIKVLYGEEELTIPSGVNPVEIARFEVGTGIDDLSIFEQGKLYGCFINAHATTSVFYMMFCYYIDSQSTVDFFSSAHLYNSTGDLVFTCTLRLTTNGNVEFSNDDGAITMDNLDEVVIYKL